MKRLNQTLEKWFSSELFTWPELKKMFLTLLLDQAFVYIISVLTTMLVSRVGEAAMAAVSLVSTVNGMVSLIFTALATGGGIVTRAENYPLLHQNGRIIWIRRPLSLLSTKGRPLSQSRNVSELYRERADAYERFADAAVDSQPDKKDTLQRILEALTGPAAL